MGGREYRFDSRDSVAVRAAWSRILRKGIQVATEDPERRIEAARFVGFVEGRLRSPAPEAWRAAIVSMELLRNEADGTVDPFFPKTFATKMGPPGSLLMGANRGDWQTQADDLRIKLTQDDRTWNLPASIGRRLAVCRSPSHDLFVASSTEIGGKYQVWRITPAGVSKQIVGRRRMSAGGGISGGHSTGWLDVRLTRRGHLAVFGVSSTVLFVDHIEPSSGQILASFSSAY